MPVRYKSPRTAMLAALLALLSLPGALRAADPPPRFTPAQLREDLHALETALHEMPPDLSHTANPGQVWQKIHDLEVQIGSDPLDRDESWRLFATLNPLLGDGHLFVGFVDWRADARQHLETGGVFFPYEMQVAPAGALYVRSALGGEVDALAGKRVISINGVDAQTLCDALLARVHGDTPAFRAALLSRRFWFYYWKMYGAAPWFDIAISGEKSARRTAGRSALPAVLADEASFERQFRLELLPNHAALLTVSSFAWPDKAQFLAFTHEAFGKMHAAGTKHLIIDLRANGGGNDEMWIDGLMPYLASKPFRWASRYRKRVVIADPARHEAVGDVVDAELDTWIPAQPRNPLHFSGKIHVLVGAATYSSAIVFSNVMQDFGFGRIAGTGDSARSATTGGTRRTTLPNCGLILVVPRFVLWRPSGAREPKLFRPDEIMVDDAFDPAAAVKALRSF